TLSEGPVAAQFGQAVGTAGDVNGDGYSDIVIGAPNYSNGQAGEGGAYIYHGSAAGLVVPYATLLESDQAGARFGISVAGAGDTNADGYFDVVIGADHWASGQSGEGAALVFKGSPTGLATAPSITLQSNEVDAHFGASVAEAGDINGDGFADIVVGAPDAETNVAQDGEGFVKVFRGSTTGTVNAFDRIEVNVAGYHLGTAVSGGGDVDGDGFSDVLSGMPGAAPAFTNEGGWQWNRGGLGMALDQLSRQYQSDLTSPLATNCMDFLNPDFFGIGHKARSPIQRCKGRLVYEVVFEGQSFSGSPITNSVSSTGMSAGWTDMGTGGAEIKELVYKTAGYIRYKWRCRVEYDPVKAIDGQRYGRWFYGYASGLGDIGVLPIELLVFDARADGNANRVTWSTATESGSESFHVERSSDLDHWDERGMLPGAGTSLQTIDYVFMDEYPPTGICFYRLAMRSTDGSVEYGPVVAVQRLTTGATTVWYDPNAGLVHVAGIGPDVQELLVTDMTGRTVQSITARGLERIDIPMADAAIGRYDLVFVGANGEQLDGRPVVRY
ncbi:MAG: FG-GAP repeat protein, partial [Flavobacteriales bacterium]|nr:FG-GAP repeat protein [Flavobacteriales bacterium]